MLITISSSHDRGFPLPNIRRVIQPLCNIVSGKLFIRRIHLLHACYGTRRLLMCCGKNDNCLIVYFADSKSELGEIVQALRELFISINDDRRNLAFFSYVYSLVSLQ